MAMEDDSPPQEQPPEPEPEQEAPVPQQDNSNYDTYEENKIDSLTGGMNGEDGDG